MLPLISLIFLAVAVPVNQGIIVEVASPTFSGFFENDVQPFFEKLISKSSELTYKVLQSFCKVDFVPKTLCPQESCKESKYRTIDGRCNNLKFPDWGTPNSTYARLLPPKYADGVHAPPISVTGENLPLSRLISSDCFPEKNVPDPKWTLGLMQYGQIIAHDLSLASAAPQNGGEPIKCCADLKSNVPNGEADPRCYPIMIPENDSFYSNFNQSCMSFVRTGTDLDAGRSLPDQPAEQITSVTAYLDASIVYGSNEELAARLREGEGGRLIVEYKNGRPFPPSALNKSATCDIQSKGEPCYRFGDTRGNQSPQLAVLQMILLREHNRVATALHNLNSHWDDETFYQETRRIVIAQHQNIVYHEYLPIIMGSENMKKEGLIYSEPKGFIDDYREDVQPAVLNEAATAAFRAPHSNIQGDLEQVQEDRQTCKVLRLSDYFNKPAVLEQGDNFDNLARGLNTQHQQTQDQYITHEVTRYFSRNGKPFGQDLRSICIQRGRDHSLASYNDCRDMCGLPKAKQFEDFADYISLEDFTGKHFAKAGVDFKQKDEYVNIPFEMRKQMTHPNCNIEKLKRLYPHADDVDLLVGGSLEQNADEALVSPTFLCILLKQFYRTRVGDRFFFERSQNNPGAFTLEQLREIRKSSLSRLMCDNGDNIQSMQSRGFEVVSESNSVASCKDTTAIPTVDLSLWKEENPENQ